MKIYSCIFLVTSFFANSLPASAAGIAQGHVAQAKETLVLERLAVNGTNRELGMGIAIFPPDSEKPRHNAIGPEAVYVLEGEIILTVDGKPARIIRAGESYQLAASDVHVAKAGPTGAKVIASWVTIPGKSFNLYK